MKGRVLGIRTGFNPNSSSLGFDVTFLLASVGAISLVTAVVSTLLRLRRPVSHGATGVVGDDADHGSP